MATIDVSPDKGEIVNTDSTVKKMRFTLPSVAASTDQVFKLTVDSNLGYIEKNGVAFESASSTDCNIWISESEDETKLGVDTIFAADAINLGYLPAIDRTYFKNQDTVSTNVLYLTVSNQDTINATGVGKINLTVGKK